MKWLQKLADLLFPKPSKPSKSTKKTKSTK
jgi:hypothetical protein